MPKLKLIFGTYNSVPVGLREESIEAVYQRAFKPFISILYNFPEMFCTLHYSGNLLAWLDKRHSEFNDVLAELLARKQIELLGGTFYDPFLTVIPRSDRLGQIESLTTYLRKRFGRRPRGGWIPETEWDSSVASTLNNCGIDYTFLGARHFRSAGLEGSDLSRPCITEDQGKTVTVFPLVDDLSDGFSASAPKKTIEALKRLHSETEEVVAVVMVDGQSSDGSAEADPNYPGMKQLERFFNLVREAQDWLEPIHPGKFIRQAPPRRKSYFPCGSREALVLASLPPEKRKNWTRLEKVLNAEAGNELLVLGGSFRQFLTRYPECNLLYSKMQYTHILVNQIKGDKYRKSSALEELWKGQCGSAYWPEPTSGGLYCNHLRKMAYRSLISAEKVTREKGVFIPSIVTADFDMDNRIEYLFQGNDMNAYIHTLGGRLFELDFLPVSWNYLDTMARHRETLDGAAYDRYSRNAFHDHFFGPTDTLDCFEEGTCREIGEFLDIPYEVVKCDREHSELVLEGVGPVATADGSATVRIVKKFIFKRASINLYYTIKNLSAGPISLTFGSEINLSFASKEVDGLRIYVLEGKEKRIQSPEKTEIPGLAELLFEDPENEVDLHFSTLEPADTWSLPIETKNGNGDRDRSYQSSCIVPRWKIALESQGAWENRLSLRMDKR